MELYNIVWGDYILNKKPLTLEKAEQELQGLKFYEPEIKKAKNQLEESNMGGFSNDLLSVIKEIESMIMNKKLGNIENHKKAQAELKILKDAYNIMWKYEPIMRLTELKQVIKEEIKSILNEAVKIYDIKPKDKIKKGTIVVAKHGTPDVLAVKRFPIHLGSGEQVESRIDSLWGSYPLFREYEVTVKLTNPCPYVIMDVDKGVGHDTTDFAKYGDYNEFIYHNTVEGYPDEENNLSIFIVDFQKSYISMKLIDTIKAK